MLGACSCGCSPKMAVIIWGSVATLLLNTWMGVQAWVFLHLNSLRQELEDAKNAQDLQDLDADELKFLADCSGFRNPAILGAGCIIFCIPPLLMLASAFVQKPIVSKIAAVAMISCAVWEIIPMCGYINQAIGFVFGMTYILLAMWCAFVCFQHAFHLAAERFELPVSKQETGSDHEKAGLMANSPKTPATNM